MIPAGSPALPDSTMSPVRLARSAAAFEQKLVRDLWMAALAGTDAPSETGEFGGTSGLGAGLPFDIFAILNQVQGPRQQVPARDAQLAPGDLGANETYRPAIEEASRRSGLPEATIAAIVGAEAATTNGVWDADSRNPRSSAVGLTQFLASTWETETERSGTTLNTLARNQGWLDSSGRVTTAARAELLALRTDPRLSIIASAEYANANLARLRAQDLVPDNASVGDLAKLAYLSHQLGAGDAERFLRGAISESRARTLLGSQIGENAAASRISASGSGTMAHRAWLIDYVDRKINLGRYTDAAQPSRSLGAIAQATA